MKRLPVGLFIVLILASVSLMLLDQRSSIRGAKSPLEAGLLPLQNAFSDSVSFLSYVSTSLLKTFEKDKKIGDLENQNRDLLSKVSELDMLRLDNAALKDQAGVRKNPASPGKLLEAKVLGKTSDLILDKGKESGVAIGDIVLVKDSVVGSISAVSERMSRASVLGSAKTNITARSLGTGAIGVVKSDAAGTILFDNVTMDQKLDKGDVVVTRGDFVPSGSGFPPGLVIGTIESVERRESELFQRAKLVQPFDIQSLQFVFIASMHE